MDDKEYYSLMNRPSSYALQQALKKKNGQNQTASKLKNGLIPTYRDLETRQGKADAEMLMEKDN